VTVVLVSSLSLREVSETGGGTRLVVRYAWVFRETSATPPPCTTETAWLVGYEPGRGFAIRSATYIAFRLTLSCLSLTLTPSRVSLYHSNGLMCFALFTTRTAQSCFSIPDLRNPETMHPP